MSILFKNARILLTKGHDFEIIKGSLITKGDRIEKITEEGGEPKGSYDREIDCHNNLLIPGFKNAHTHTAMTFLRSYADDMPLSDWLYNQVFPKEGQLTEEDVYYLSILGIMEYLTSGITCNFDMYLKKLSHVKASVDCGYRSVFTDGLNNFGGSAEKMEEEHNYINSLSPLTSHIVGFHAEYTTSLELMESVAKLANKVKSPVYLHNSETEAEVKECMERYGKTPTELTDSLGMYEYGGGGYHCVYLSEKDFEIFKNKGLYAVTNPASNLKLASGIAPLTEFLNRGIGLAIGTDGSASNNALDFFREMYLAATLPKVAAMDASAMPANEVLYAATAGGALAMGLSGSDCLSEGKLADLVMIDMHAPNMQPENNIVKNLVYAGSKANVLLTMVGGVVLYEKGEFNIGFDKEEIYKKANAIIGRMK